MAGEEVVIPWDDGFVPGGGSAKSTLVRYPKKAGQFVSVYDDVLPEAVRARVYAAAVAGEGKPWGVYVPLEPEAGERRERQELARLVVETILARSGLDLGGAHGVAVWCLASGPGDSVEYHIDYSELHRYETHEIVPPLYAGTYQATAEPMRGGDFYVNDRGLEHYSMRGYKSKVDLDDPGWMKITYRANRAILHDGEWPHFSSTITHLDPPARRVILGFNVFSARVSEVNRRAPEHSPQFNATVKLYQALRGRLTLDAVKADKRLSKLLVGLARSRLDRGDLPSCDLVPGARVLARWRTGLRLWPATVVAVDANLHLRYDDGLQWTDAPPAVVKRALPAVS
mmetsp:Transcript_19748/g.62162  ORF Transcript_19748/g.62162 Transcript_19748/m.62162 type:complete len:342 (+) Transcript_19748:110-1135(+)